MSKDAKKPIAYERNRVMFSLLDGTAWFCPRLQVLAGGIRRVVGKKFDVTGDLQPYLLKRYRKKP